jgi:hypothetical protein
MKKSLPPVLGFILLLQGSLPSAFAWDYDGHRVVNQLACASLPTNFPAFVRTAAARERIAFLGGEADRWRNAPDLPLRHFNGPDHYIDIEELEPHGLTPQSLPLFRYDFVARLALARAAHPEKFPAIDPARNEDHTRELVGLLPWTIAEYYGKLRSGFAYLKALTEAGTPEEIANAQENIIYLMGVMGHFPADAAQPLHLTIHHHGWVGANPQHYTTNTTIHRWIDGEYLLKTGGLDAKKLQGRLRPAALMADSGKGERLFAAIAGFIAAQQQQVEPLYRLEKEGKFSGEGENGLAGRAFLEDQLLKGSQLLGDLWLSAWQQAPEDNFLKTQLAKRKAGNGAAPAKP